MKNKIGTYLQQHREAKHLTLEQVAEHTGIREPYLAALEEGDFHKIPGDVFIRGFLRNYGNYLGLDGNGLVEAYRTGSEPEKILKSPEPLVPQPELPKSSDTIILRPETFAGKKQAKTEPPVPQPASPKTESSQAPEPFDKVQALKDMEPVGYGNSRRTAQEAQAPQKRKKEAMEATQVMKPVKPAAQAAPTKPEAAKEAAGPEPQTAPGPKAAQPVAGTGKPEAPKGEETAKRLDKTGEKKAPQPEKPAANGAQAAAVGKKPAGKGTEPQKSHESPKEALKKVETALNRENMEEALDASKAKVGGVLDRIRDFIDENLYETVPEDEAGEEYGAAGGADSKTPAFSFKVFTGVFVACLAVFTVVMAYFVFGGKTTPDLKATTNITDGVKSDHSSEKSEKEKQAAAEAQPKKEEEESKGDEKTLGKGNGVTVVVTYKKPVWTQTTIDGKQVEAATVPKGSTRTYKGSKSISVNVGSIRDVVITVNGKEIPYGSKEWGVVTRTFKAK